MQIKKAEIVVCNEPSLDVATWWWQIQLNGRVAAESRRMPQVDVEPLAERLRQGLEVDRRIGTGEDIERSHRIIEWPPRVSDASEVLLFEGRWELLIDGEAIAVGWANKPRFAKDFARWVADAMKLPCRRATHEDDRAREQAIRQAQLDERDRRREVAKREGLGVIDVRKERKRRAPGDLNDLLRDET